MLRAFSDSHCSDFGLIDEDTPAEALTYTSLQTGDVWQLVFSDEFEQEGRTFWPGDDPFWSAEDLHYCAFSTAVLARSCFGSRPLFLLTDGNLVGATNNLEWYSPGQLETKNGSLVITLDKRPHRGMECVDRRSACPWPSTLELTRRSVRQLRRRPPDHVE